MKYTKLFNNHSEYVAYIASESFIRPNVSYCIQEGESHCTPMGDTCIEQHIYEIMGEPSYPSSVPASATSFELSFTYTDTYTSVTCDQGSFMDGDTVTIPIEENPSMSARTISGTYVFHDISIPYSFTQEGREELPYNQQYLTFEVLSGGTIVWKAATTAVTRTISYSINDGEWTEITSSTGGTEINVSVGDKVRFKGNNTRYATGKDVASMFSGGTATYDAYGNVMSLIGGDNFSGLTSFNGQEWVLHDLFNTSNVVSAKNLILPVTTLTKCCYRAMFAHSMKLTEAPELPATTLASSGYWYTFQECVLLEKAPDLLAETIVDKCYGGMFDKCRSLNYIKCTATSGISTANTESWVNEVASSGTFIKASSVNNWSTGKNGIPTDWQVYNDTNIEVPIISFNGFNTITITCETQGADILYRLNESGEYSAYTTPIIINEDTFIETYSEYEGETSRTISQTCQYVSDVPIEYSNRDLKKWKYSGQEITTPYSVNAIDGHSSNYAKGTFNFETTFALSGEQPTYLWFQHADQSAEIYIDNTLVEKHWGGYAAFTTDVSEYVHEGINSVKVAIKNNEGNNVAPASGDFNFNATLGNVRLLTSPYVPAMNYGYDGFHITSTVSDAEATVNIKTSVPTGATLVCKIDDGNTNIYSATSASTGEEMTFTKVIANPHLWNGKSDPYMYTVTLEIYEGNDLYHRFVRPYGLRYYEYVINDTEKVGTVSEPYTGFLLNGSPYLLRGVCMHDDIDGKANALTETDYDNTFATIQELGCNFLRLAHYPHPKEVYDRCDALGIVVQTEGPCVNKLQSTMPAQYYTHLTGQYTDMVNQHYNHPCIFFWGLSNETSTDDKNFGKQKVEEYTALIKNLDSERMVGYVLAQGNGTSPSAYYNDPSNVDWFGCNIYVGWYDSPNSNNPSSQITTRLNNTIGRVSKPMAYSEYGCGGTPTCHSDDFMTTTTRGNNPRHDIEYMMWLHEGHIAAIKNFPQLMYTSQWQLFDIAVASRNEGYTECLDGVNTSTNDALRRLNNKGLVERDHVTKKDTFYLYKAWWNTTDKFVHICQQNYQKIEYRAIKCYTNDGNSLTMYVNGVSAATATVTDNIAVFEEMNFSNQDTIMVCGSTASDSFIISGTVHEHVTLTAKYNVTDTSSPTIIGGSGCTAAFSSVEIDGVEQPSVTSAYTFSTTGEHTIKYRTRYNQSIYEYALSGCSDITSIELEDGTTELINGCFKECTSLSSITIPNSVTLIDNSVFKGCTSLTSCTIGTGVKQIKDGAFSGCTNLETITIPDSVTSITSFAFARCGLTSIHIPSGVTNINSGAFMYNANLSSITVDINNTKYDSRDNCNAIINGNILVVGCKNTVIPSDVTNIYQYAFAGHSNLININIPSGVTAIGAYAFDGCSGLTSIDIPNSVITIGSHSFRNCSDLTNVTLSNKISRISEGAFAYCSSLDNIVIPSGVTQIITSAFTYCTSLTSIVIPSGVTSIGNHVFSRCSGLTNCVIEGNITNINASLFESCTSLTSITLPNSVTSIGNTAFQDCTSLTSIDIPSGVTSIGNGAFSDCSGLIRLNSNIDGVFNLPSGVTSINNLVFKNCSSLTSIVIPDSVTSIGDRTFTGCISLTSIDIPDSVTSINQYAFENCTGLTSVTIGSGLTSISNNVFSNCSGLTSITIPNSVTSIGQYAFTNCRSLPSIVIPSSVTSIGNNILSWCTSLTSVTVLATTPPTAGTKIFDGTNNNTVYVPSGSVDAYKAASGWSTYESRIQAIP